MSGAGVGAAPPPPDDFRDPPWQDDCRIFLDDGAWQVPPNAHD